MLELRYAIPSMHIERLCEISVMFSTPNRKPVLVSCCGQTKLFYLWVVGEWLNGCTVEHFLYVFERGIYLFPCMML